MKRCPYCGAEYPDDVVKCPVDEECLLADAVPEVGNTKKGYDIPPLPPAQRTNVWATILSPHSRFEAEIVLGRLQASGIRARFSDSVIGGWVGRDTMTFVQVRVEDYDAARKLLNGA